MNQERILQAAIKKTRTMIESGELTDAEGFALAVLADFAVSMLAEEKYILEMTARRLQDDFCVRVSSDLGIHSV